MLYFALFYKRIITRDAHDLVGVRVGSPIGISDPSE